MRTIPSQIGLACVLVSLVACTTAPNQEPRSAPPPASASKGASGDIPMELRKFDVQSKDGSVTFRFGDYHCAHPSHPTYRLYGDCNGIPVAVLENPYNGDCIAVHPYANLIIHSDRMRTLIVWQIFGGRQYEFDRTQDGITLGKMSGTTDPTLPGDNYDRKQHQGQRWKWELRDDAKYPKTFYHLPYVVNTTNGKPCVPIDPGMINVVN